MVKEYLDIYNDKMVKIGVANRDMVHRLGFWHKTFHCWFVSQEGTKRYLLFQKRSAEKEIFPNALDITVAGHLIAGEEPENGIRELQEELGLTVDFEELIHLGIRCNVAQIGDFIEREFCYTYLYECNIPLDEYRLQRGEVVSIVKLELDEGIRMFSGQTQSAWVSGYQINEAGIYEKIEYEIKQKDIIPCIDNYYLKMLNIAEQYFNNHKYLTI